MHSSKIALAAVVGLVTTTANAHAAPMPSDGAGIQQISNAALEQVLEKSNIHLVGKKRPRPYTQENGPTYVKFQQMILRKTTQVAPNNTVAAVFATLNLS